MGYNLNLIKCNSYDEYLDGKHTSIGLDEWKRIIEKHEVLKYQENIEWMNTMNNSVIKIPGEFGVGVFQGTSMCFNLSNGKITVAYDKNTLDIVLKLTLELNRKCFGDEGEEY